MQPSLKERFADVPQLGTIAWVGVRPAHGAPMQTLLEVEVMAGHGLSGDVAASGAAGGKRQVTLIQFEHLAVVAALCRLDIVQPQQLRRNLVVAGINVHALRTLRFAIGAEVILRGSGNCAPCSKMDEALGPGGFHALRGHGGITAEVERGGSIRLGDSVRALPNSGTE